MVEALFEAYLVEEVAGALLGVVFADPGGEHDVFECGEFWEEEVMLEDKAHAAVAEGGAFFSGAVVERAAVDEDIS